MKLDVKECKVNLCLCLTAIWCQGQVISQGHQMKCPLTLQKLNVRKYLHDKVKGPVPVAARSKACTVFNRSNTGIVASNPCWGMDVSAFFYILLSCVLRRADPPSKECYHVSNRFISFRK